jgi:hypothetical protein
MVYAFERMMRNRVIACVVFFLSELATVISHATMEYVNYEVCIVFMMATYMFSVLVLNLFCFSDVGIVTWFRVRRFLHYVRFCQCLVR